MTKQNTPPAVSVNKLRVQFGEHVILRNVSFTVAAGSITAIIGPNGSGKSTLVKAMLDLLPYQGDVQLFGTSIDNVRDRIGYVPQRFTFDRDFPITVQEFLHLPLNEHKTGMRKILKAVQLPQSILRKQLGQLSGGQLQRVLIAQALIHQPALLIMDEPAAGIDVAGEAAFFDVLDSVRKDFGTTIIIVSHDISFVANAVDQVVCVNKHLLCCGPPKLTLTQENLEKLFGGTNIYHHHTH